MFSTLSVLFLSALLATGTVVEKVEGDTVFIKEVETGKTWSHKFPKQVKRTFFLARDLLMVVTGTYDDPQDEGYHGFGDFYVLDVSTHKHACLSPDGGIRALPNGRSRNRSWYAWDDGFSQVFLARTSQLARLANGQRVPIVKFDFGKMALNSWHGGDLIVSEGCCDPHKVWLIDIGSRTRGPIGRIGRRHKTPIGDLVERSKRDQPSQLPWGAKRMAIQPRATCPPDLPEPEDEP